MIKLQKIFNRLDLMVDAGDRVCMQDPRGYQLTDLKKLLSWQRAADFSEVGTGKSLKSYLYIIYKVLRGGKVVVVMPPPLLPQYISQFEEIFPDLDFDMQNFTMPAKKRHALLDEIETLGILPDVSFMSYQMFVKMHRFFIDHKMDVLICDEAHAIKTVTTKNFTSIYKYLTWADGAFLEMTATPITAELRDAYAHIQIKSPHLYPSLRAFDTKHTIYKDVGDFPKIVGYRDEDLIRQRINFQAVRQRACEVLSLEEPMIVEQRIDLSGPHIKLYKKLLKERILELGDRLLIGENPQKLRQMALQLVTNVQDYTETKIVDEPLNMLKAIMDTIGPDKKILVFCNYRSTVEKLAIEFQHLNPATMYGGSNVPKNADKFNNDETTRIGIANYRSGGAGLNLQARCHNVCFYEPTGVPAELTQAMGRVQRSGQTEVVNAWLFRYTGTISVRLIDSALKRTVGIKEVMQDKESVLDALLLGRD